MVTRLFSPLSIVLVFAILLQNATWIERAAAQAVCTVSQITLTTSDTPDPVSPNEDLTYTITLTNACGQAQVTNLWSTLDANVIFLSASDGGAIQNGNQVYWPSLSVPANGAKTVTITVRVSGTAQNGTTLTLATLAGSSIQDIEHTYVFNDGKGSTQCSNGLDDDGDGATDFPADPGCTDLQDNDEANPAANLSIDKTGPTTVQQGGIITYTLSVTNAGPGTALDTVVADDFDAAQLTFLPQQSTQGCAIAQNNPAQVLCPIGTYAPNQPRTFTLAFQVSQTAACDGEIHNQADIQARNGLFAWDHMSTTVSCPPVPTGPCIDRISVQDGYSFLKAKNDLYFHLTVHKTAMNDWVSVNDNAPWGQTLITDIDLTETPKGRRDPSIAVAVVSAGSEIYQHGDLRNTGTKNWASISRNKPWGTTTVSNVGISGRNGNSTSHGILSARNSAYYYASDTRAKYNPYGSNVWVDVSDNRPWGSAAIDDIDVSMSYRGLVQAGGTLYYHPHLHKLAKYDWVPVPAKEKTTGDLFRNAERVDIEFGDAFGSRGSDAIYTSGIGAKHKWNVINDNKPWGNADIDDVTVFQWYGVDPWGTRSIAMVVADDKPYLHWRPRSIKKTGPTHDWVDTSDNAPWNIPGGSCNRQPPAPQLQIFKNGPESIERGDLLTYSVTVLNGGQVSAQSVIVTDPVPAGLTFVPSSSSAGCSLQSGAVRCSLGTVAAGQLKTLTLSFDVPTVASCSPVTITNTATVGSTPPPPANTNTSSSTQTTITCPPQGPSLEITKLGPETILPGQTITYTVDVRNSGTAAAQDTVVVDRFDNTVLTYLPNQSTAGCALETEGSDQVIRCTVGTLGVNQTRSFTFAFQVFPSAQCQSDIENIADVQARDGFSAWDSVVTLVDCEEQVYQCSDGLDNDYDGNTDFPADPGCTSATDNDETNQVTYQCSDGIDNDGDALVDYPQDPGCTSTTDNSETNVQQGTPHLSIDKTGPATAAQGGTILYTLTANNTGTASSFDTIVSDIFDAQNLTYLPNQSSQGCSLSGQQIQCAIGTFNAGQTRTFTLAFQMSPSAACNGSIHNQADIQARDGLFAWDSMTSTVTCHQAALKTTASITKNANRDEAQPGDVIIYTVTVSNLTANAAQNVTITDTVTHGTVTVTDPAGGTVNGNVITWTLPVLGPNAVHTIVYRLQAALSMNHGESIDNTVRATSASFEYPVQASDEVRILRALPQTGIASSFTTSWNNTVASLQPTLQAGSPSQTPAAFILWATLIAFGILGGSVAGKRLFL